MALRRSSGALAALGVVALVVIGVYGSPFVLTVVVLTMLAVITGSAMNIVMGYAGLLNLAVGAFYGIGAYTTAIMTVRHDQSFWMGAVTGVIISGVIAVISAPFILRTRGLYFAVATLALGVIFTDVATNWVDVTGGTVGIAGFERPTALGFGPLSIDLSSLGATYAATAVVMVLALIGIAVMSRRRFGRVLLAIKEDEILVRSAGFNVLGFKSVAYVASAMLAAVAGSLYLLMIQYVSPAPFTFLTAGFQAFVVVAVGGGGTVSGPIVAAALLIGGPAFLDFSPFVNQVVYGVALLIVVTVLRNGIVPEILRVVRRRNARTAQPPVGDRAAEPASVAT